MSSSALFTPQQELPPEKLLGYTVEHLTVPMSQISFKPAQVDLLIDGFMLKHCQSFKCQDYQPVTIEIPQPLHVYTYKLLGLVAGVAIWFPASCLKPLLRIIIEQKDKVVELITVRAIIQTITEVRITERGSW